MNNLFNNSDVLMSSWYALMPSRKLKKGQVKKIVLLDRSIAVFRIEDGQVYAFDSRCPHLGADLSRGCVVGNRLRCEFHHWAFDGNGECQEIPYMSDIPKSAKVFSYPIEEQYGFIWLFNGSQPTFSIPFFKTWDQDQLVPVALPKMIFNCHSHIATCNGLDIQHMRSLHNMELLEEPVAKEIDEYRIQVKYKIAFTGNSLMDKITRFFLGKSFILDFMTWSGNMAMGEVPHKDWPILLMFNHIGIYG